MSQSNFVDTLEEGAVTFNGTLFSSIQFLLEGVFIYL